MNSLVMEQESHNTCPIGYQGQIEGGGVMVLGYTLMEEAMMDKGIYLITEVPKILLLANVSTFVALKNFSS